MEGHEERNERIADRAARNFIEDSYNCAEGLVAAFSEARGEEQLSPPSRSRPSTGSGRTAAFFRAGSPFGLQALL